MIGAGFQGKGIARQIIRYTAGMRLCAIANRRIEPAIEAFKLVGEMPLVCEVSQLTLELLSPTGVQR